jgi:hypothetical protein
MSYFFLKSEVKKSFSTNRVHKIFFSVTEFINSNPKENLKNSKES